MHKEAFVNQFTMQMGDKPELKELLDYIAGII